MSLKILGSRSYFWQWDTGQQLLISNDDCGEVHFCNGTDDCALVAKIKTAADGSRVVDVPNILLQEAKPIRAYLFSMTENCEQTIKMHRFSVMPRTRPADYVYTETEVKTWEALEEEIRDAIDLVGYYTPVVDHENNIIYFEPSRPGMPDVDPVAIPKGEKGDPGANGEPGITPHIGENGNWYIGDTDTGIAADGSTKPAIADIAVTESADGSVTMVNTLVGGGTETLVISADANGNSSKLTYNGTEIPITWNEVT